MSVERFNGRCKIVATNANRGNMWKSHRILTLLRRLSFLLVTSVKGGRA